MKYPELRPMNWLDYREQLGIGFNDEQKIQYFLTKIINTLKHIKSDMLIQIDEKEYYEFCNITGTPLKQGKLYGEGYSLILSILENNACDIRKFIAYYTAFINCQEDNRPKRWKRDNFKKLLCDLLDETHIQFDIIEDEHGFFLFPKGANIKQVI